MWLLKLSEAKNLDATAIAAGSEEKELIEKAGSLSAAMISRLLPRESRATSAAESVAVSVVVLCGPGNNGADGEVAARHLSELGYQVDLIKFHQLSNFLTAQKNYAAYVDALFGIGLSRPLSSLVISVIQKINSSSGMKFSLDIPSGLNADTGTSFGAIFKADYTLSVESAKPGFYLNLGPEHCGKIHLLKNIFPAAVCKQAQHSVFLLSRALVRRWLPARSAIDSKTRGGKTLILAGSRPMPGAALLSSTAAARSGAGYVFVTEKEILETHPEFLLWEKKDFSKFSSVLIGPGFGTGSKTKKLLSQLKRTDLPVVVDADAFTVLASEKKPVVPANWILTPHAGELSRLLPLSAKEIEADRLTAATQAQKKTGAVVVLKGFHTVIACKNISLIVPTGNAALGKAGSGDVLAGMIAGFLAQKVSPERAAALACYIHGLLADRWLKTGNDILSLQPSDLLLQLPQALADLRKTVIR